MTSIGPTFPIWLIFPPFFLSGHHHLVRRPSLKDSLHLRLRYLPFSPMDSSLWCHYLRCSSVASICRGTKKRAVSNSFLIYWQVRVLDRREIGRVFRIPHNLFKSGKNRKQNKKWWAQENGKGCNSWGRTAVTKENNADGRIPLPSGMCGFKSSPSISVFSATSPFVGASPCSDAYTVSPGKIHMNRAAIAVVTVHPLFGWTRCAVAV